jgi:pyruvate-formate lyase
MIAGKSDQELIRGFNFLLILEWVLNRGKTRCRDAQEGIDSGDPRTFASFEDVMAAWKRQLDEYLGRSIDYIGSRYTTCDLQHSNHGRYAYNPMLSALTRTASKKNRISSAAGQDMPSGTVWRKQWPTASTRWRRSSSWCTMKSSCRWIRCWTLWTTTGRDTRTCASV